MKKFNGWVVRNPWAAVFWACAIFWAVAAVVVALAVLA
ncbi:Uncharacterised protein [Serratia quinivorans]|nr:Uncharacterised protein [Serratia quinivorans]CAI1543425.1 Uncharacterised protein [Serratia quinivorans]